MSSLGGSLWFMFFINYCDTWLEKDPYFLKAGAKSFDIVPLNCLTKILSVDVLNDTNKMEPI